jgi:hypothetical protein
LVKKLARLERAHKFYHDECIRLGLAAYYMGNDEMFRDPFKWARLQAECNRAANIRRRVGLEIDKVEEKIKLYNASKIC